MGKRNCWEVRRCGREPGGDRVALSGVCPAAAERRLDGVNGGVNAGRACWAIAGTLCAGGIQGSYATKAQECLRCELYEAVCAEEGEEMVHTRVILAKLYSPE